MKQEEQGKKQNAAPTDHSEYDISEAEFLAAIEEMDAMELAELEAIAAEADTNPHQFSKDFEARKEALIHEVEEREKAAAQKEEAATKEIEGEKEIEDEPKIPFIYRLVNTPLKKVAIITLVAGGVALGGSLQTTAGKFPVVKFFQDLYGDHIEIEPHEDLWRNEEKPQTIEEVYELGWIPEGYEMEKEQNGEYVTTHTYSNKKQNERIILEQYCVAIYYSIKEQEGYQEIKEDGKKYYYLDGAEEKTLVWYEDGYQFILRADLELDEILKMSRKLEKSY